MNFGKDEGTKIYKFAEWLHDNYEELALRYNWKTNEKCNLKPFKKLPLANKQVMLKLSERILLIHGKIKGE